MASNPTPAQPREPYFDLPSWQNEIVPFFRHFNLKRLASLVAVALSLYHLYTGYTGEPVELTISGECPGTLSVQAVRSADGAELLVGETEVA